MTSRSGSQKGSALALVMWLLSAMTVMVAGAVSMSRDEVRLSGTAASSARAFYLGKGVARLAVLERAQTVRAVDINSEPEERRAVFSKRYAFNGAAVHAKVMPASGFVSLQGSDDETWEALLINIGGLDAATAKHVANRFSSASGGGGGAPAGVTSFGAYRYKYGGGSGRTTHVESLLSIEGMTRDAYDRVYPYISPLAGPSTPNLAFSPDKLVAVFSNDVETDEQVGGGNGGAYCVEIEIDFGPGDRFVQRVWVNARDAANGAVQFVRIERPVRSSSSTVS